MQLTRLSVTREEWGENKGKLTGRGENKGKLTGRVEFSGPHGKVELPLDEKMSHDMVAICSEAIVRMSKGVAEEMTADVIQGLTALPAGEH